MFVKEGEKIGLYVNFGGFESDYWLNVLNHSKMFI